MMSSQDMMVCAAYKHELANNTNIPEYVIGWIQSRIKQLESSLHERDD